MTTTRFAPSPTGYIHVGNLRTALMAWLIARKAGGTFILRLDDTDRERSKQEYADGIQEDLEWLGLTWDRLERQSDRLDRYAEAADGLRTSRHLYEVFETPTELDLKRKKLLNMGRPPVYDRAGLNLSDADRAALRAEGREGYWRFRLDQNRIEWTDGILGDISIDAASLSDPVLIRADGQVLYTFASSVDDLDMGVTDIVRGADHVTNTATQIQIIAAMGGRVPGFAHHSLLTGADGEGLSKRLGALSLRDLRAQGVAKEALLSMMARLGSSQPIEVKMSLDEIAAGFDLSQFGAAPTRFDQDDLWPLTRHANQHAALCRGERADRRAGRAGRDGRGVLGRRVAQHHKAGRAWRLVGAVPRRSGTCHGGRGPRVCETGAGDAARAAVRYDNLGRMDERRQGRDGAQGQDPVPPAASCADRSRERARDGGPDAAAAEGAGRLTRQGLPSRLTLR